MLEIVKERVLGVIPTSPLGIMQDIISRNAFTLGINRDDVIAAKNKLAENARALNVPSEPLNRDTLVACLQDLPLYVGKIGIRPHSDNSLAMVYSIPDNIAIINLAKAAEINPVARRYFQLNETVTSEQLANRIINDAINNNKDYYPNMMAFYEVFHYIDPAFRDAAPDVRQRTFQLRLETKLPESDELALPSKTDTYCTAILADDIASAIAIFSEHLPDSFGLKSAGFWYTFKDDAINHEVVGVAISVKDKKDAEDFYDAEYSNTDSVTTGYRQPPSPKNGIKVR